MPGAGDRAHQWVLPGRRSGGGGELRHARGRRRRRSSACPRCTWAAVGDRSRAAAGTDRLGPDARDAADGRAVFGAPRRWPWASCRRSCRRRSWTRPSITGSTRICRATPEAVRSQKALIDRWERVSIDEGIYAGIDALSDAYKTGEPQAAIKAFFAAKAKKRLEPSRLACGLPPPPHALQGLPVGHADHERDEHEEDGVREGQEGDDRRRPARPRHATMRVAHWPPSSAPSHASSVWPPSSG